MLGEKSLHEIDALIERYPALGSMRQDVVAAVELLVDCCRQNGRILICGNGGSAADSLHIVGELMKAFAAKRRVPQKLQAKLREQWGDLAEYYIENLQGAIPAHSLVNETALITAYSNDNTADLAFAQQVLGYGRKHDVFWGISTSGNSDNILHAARIARTLEMNVISMTGAGGGELKSLSDVCLAVPSGITYQVQEYHLPVYHAMCLALEADFLYGGWQQR